MKQNGTGQTALLPFSQDGDEADPVVRNPDYEAVPVRRRLINSPTYYSPVP